MPLGVPLQALGWLATLKKNVILKKSNKGAYRKSLRIN